MKPDILISSLTIDRAPVEDIGADAAKALPPGRRYRYKVSGVYTLADGQEVACKVSGMTRPKLAERVASLQKSVAAGHIKAWFDDAGAFAGTSTTFGL